MPSSKNPITDTSFEIRWSKITPDKVVPGMEEAIVAAQAAIDKITALEPTALTFENTFLALDEATYALNAAWVKVEHLQAVADSPAFRAAYNEALALVTAFQARIPLNVELWKRLKACAATPAVGALTGVKARLVSETLAEFRTQGADLPSEKRSRMEELQGELAQLTQKYSENVLDATNAWQLVITDEARLAGLPERAKAAARKSAESKGLGTEDKPAWRFTLHMPSLDPVLKNADDVNLRRQVWEASEAVGTKAPSDNTALIPKILALRQEKAVLVGKAHFPDMILERRMAKTGAHAMAFETDLQRRTQAAFGRECGELEKFKAEQTRGAGAQPARLAPWEIAYWAEKMRKASYDFDEEALRPYFSMEQVMAGLFEIANRIYGVRVVEKAAGKVDVWHPDVKVYDLFSEKGDRLGMFYTDWHPRESKRGGAWMNNLITGGIRPDGTRAPHLGLICGNMTGPVDGKPALLNHREVETIFHEFGHLMHHLLTEVPIKSLAGTNVAWDFVELPSQIMENWTWERDGLDLFARHYETGDKIPQALFEKMMAARNFRSACTQMRQLSFGRMDLLLHLSANEFAVAPDVEPGIRRLVADCLIPSEPPAPTNVKRFNHLFANPVGYASGYYSYKWAEVLDADAFTRFKREGIFSRSTGQAFVDCILSKGNSEDPAVLFRSFMGRDPDLDSLLRRNGILV